MSQATVIDHISLEDLPPHVISYLSGYHPSERSRIAKKLLAYAVSKLEVCEYLFRYTLYIQNSRFIFKAMVQQKSEKPQNLNRYYQPPAWWGHEDNKEIKKNNKKSSKLPIEDQCVYHAPLSFIGFIFNAF
jgi:hypothetical protein